MNPIYIEFGIHQGEDCYKIDIPWTNYGKETIILCRVSGGYKLAKCLALDVITEKLTESMKKEPIKD